MPHFVSKTKIKAIKNTKNNIPGTFPITIA